MSDPQEAKVVAAVIARISAIRGGAIHVPSPSNAVVLLDSIARDAPKMYHEMMEDAELLIEALDKYRRGRK